MLGKKEVFKIILVVCLLLIVPIASAAEKCTIWLPGEQARWMQDAGFFDKLEKENPELEFNFVSLPWDILHDKLLTGFAGGELPDLAYIADHWVGEFAFLNVLEPLDAFKEEAGYDDAKFLPGSWEHFKYFDGHYYAAPYVFESRVLFYRTDLLVEAGLNSPPTNWKELMEYGLKLTNGVDRFGLSHQDGWLDFHFFSCLLYSNGGDFYSEDRKEATLTKPEAIEALKFYSELYKNNVIPKDPAKRAEAFKGFKEGYYAMAESGPWWLGMLRNQAPELDGKWATSLMPAGKEFVTYGHPQAWIVPKAANNKEAAYRSIKFFNRPDNFVAYYIASGELPSLIAAWNCPVILQDSGAMTMFLAAVNGVKSIHNIPQAEAVSEFAWNTLAEIRDDKITAEDAAQQMNGKIERILEMLWK